MKGVNMKRSIFLLVVLFAAAGFSAANSLQPGKELVRAAPNLLNYQGYLTDMMGMPTNDTMDIRFRIYDDETGGSILWDEWQLDVPIENGVFSVLLGSTTPVPDSVFLGCMNCWLEIRANGQNLTPRTRITATAYAYSAKHADHSIFSDSALYAYNAVSDSDWIITGDTMYCGISGQVAVGEMKSPLCRFSVSKTGGGPALGVFNEQGTSGTFPGSVVYYGVFASTCSDDSHLKLGLLGLAGGSAGIASGVQGNAFGYGSVNYGVYGTASHADTNWAGFFDGNGYFKGNVGIGTKTPSAETKLHIQAATDNFGILVDAAGASGSEIGLHTATSKYASLAKNAYFSAGWYRYDTTSGAFLEEVNPNGNVDFKITNSGSNPISWITTMNMKNDGRIGMGVQYPHAAAKLHVKSDGLYAGYFSADSTDTLTHVVHAVYNGGNEDASAVYGKSVPADGYGIGGFFEGGINAVHARVNPTGSGNYNGVRSLVYGGSGHNYGVSGLAYNSSGTSCGVYGYSPNSTNAYGVYGEVVYLSAGNYAGYFLGNVHVTGTLSKGSGSFLIDHPLDPENKTLRHNFVESPENLCLYRGTVTLDNSGEGVVHLPDYFAALTKENEATITLTPIGKRPFLTSYEWNDNYTAFSVYGEADKKVTYIVLADRDDPVMHQLYRPVEEDKGNGNFEKGKLLYPEAYGYPIEKGVDYSRHMENH
jgi:hypothetical protein